MPRCDDVQANRALLHKLICRCIEQHGGGPMHISELWELMAPTMRLWDVPEQHFGAVVSGLCFYELYDGKFLVRRPALRGYVLVRAGDFGKE